MCSSHVVSHECRAVVARDSRHLENAGTSSALVTVSRMKQRLSNPAARTDPADGTFCRP